MNKDLKTKKDIDLQKDLASKRSELQKIRFTFSHGGNKDTKKQSNLKREIARILNELRIRDLK